jgi:triosephosphate isomerase
MRQKIAAGNWKMNNTPLEGQSLVNEMLEILPAKRGSIVLCVPAIHLERIAHALRNSKDIGLGAQDCSSHEAGAYTGEISAAMLASVGVKYCIVGHSERREYHHESPELIAQKVDLLLKHGMTPIFCCGEPLAVRDKEKHISHVRKQIKLSLGHLTPEQAVNLVIAYEPVWAIGTGRTASPAQAQEMHYSIRKLLGSMFGKRFANRISILYGGSVTAASAAELFSNPDVDGGLVGGASLKAKDFLQIAGALSH